MSGLARVLGVGGAVVVVAVEISDLQLDDLEGDCTMSEADAVRSLTARDAGMEGARLWQGLAAGQDFGGRCGVPNGRAAPDGLQRVWAWLAAAMVLYIPANLYPMLQTSQQGKVTGPAPSSAGIVDLVSMATMRWR